MKKLVLSAFLALGTFATFAQQVVLSNSKPEAGNPLSFTYNPAGGSLDKLANVTCQAYTFINMKQKVVKIPLTKEGNLYKGSFVPEDSTAIAVFAFAADGTKDENPKGYFTLFYNKGEPTAMSYFWEAQLYSGMGKAYAGIPNDGDKTIAAYEKAFLADPKLRPTYLSSYLTAQLAKDKVKGEQLVKNEVATLKAIKSPAETDYTTLSNMYRLLKNKTASDSVLNVAKTKFPFGTTAYGARYTALNAEKDFAKKEILLNALIKDFKLDASKKADAAKLTSLYSTMANAAGLAKNNAKFTLYSDKITDNMSRASLYNSFAWASAEKKENLEYAAKISGKSLSLIEAAKNDPVPSYYSSKEEYIEGLDDTYSTFADTYALLLDHLGKKEEALKYQEIAVTMNKFANPEMNERYVSFLRKNGKNDKVVELAEKFTKEGKGSDAMKADLKLAYKGSESFEVYYAALEKEALQKEREKFAKEMINKPAPVFSLVNLKGETVSLEKLKGKVVIVDYWATWCGPCVASFPGMQKAVDKYKADPNVVFLFVNTWQTEDNREKVVTDFLATTPYTFNVLYDTKNKQDPSKFDVIAQYDVEGIPTKFIIDGNGNIRFKKVGFSGSADVTVKELDIMIEMARNAGATK